MGESSHQSKLSDANAQYSRFVQRVRRRCAPYLELLAAGVPRRASIESLIDELLSRQLTLTQALRLARNIVLERLVVQDIEHQAALAEVCGAVTELAEVCLQRALREAQTQMDARYGPPLAEDGSRIDFWVVGMGKLGGRELNVSSDIDLVYVYDEDGMTTGVDNDPLGRSRVTAHEYFAQLARALYQLIGETTDEGFVFRVDLALRPNGNSGPPVVSLAMLEEYFLTQGCEWERFAWLKSRVVAPALPADDPKAMGLRDVVRPFVFRRYLDYSIFEALRHLHQKIRDEAARRAAGRPQRASDIKLSRGGIREIEFTVQLLQVVRGGQYPEIRTRSTLQALQRLSAQGVMSEQAAQRLAEAYHFLRRLEHRIQYLDDQQTHTLPQSDEDLAWIASSMVDDFLPNPCSTGPCALIETLCAHREAVAAEFDALMRHDRSGAPGCRSCNGAEYAVDSEAYWALFSAELGAKIREFALSPRIKLLPEASRYKLARILGLAAQIASALVAAGPGAGNTPYAPLPPGVSAASLIKTPQEARQVLVLVGHLMDFLQPLMRRGSYLALLIERPDVLHRLLRLLNLARWPMHYLLRHPGVIDELADARLIHSRFDPRAYLNDLEQRRVALARSGQDDDEALLDTLRHAHHAEVFRVLVRDVEGELSVEQVADELSALADATIECTLRWGWMRHHQRHRDEPQLAIIAYGKLGGKELGYGSDLDVVFLYEDDDERAPEIYAGFVRKLITWLSLRTGAGELFEIDTALRPNGNSGLLVTTMRAFEDYQTQRGSNTAWTWEHQAITRARWCAGAPQLAPKFEAVRREVLKAPRDRQALREEVKAMRERLRAAHRVPEGEFDFKHSPGGMIDAEFVIQYLVLAYSAQHPELMDDVGNIALFLRAQQADLLPDRVGQAAADAYRALRLAQHRARLDEMAATVSIANLGPLAAHQQAVRRAWQAVFE